MYPHPFHKPDISKNSFLITGGAGFIGSHIVEYLLNNNAWKVRVLDNLSTGKLENLDPFKTHPGFEWINGDIRDIETCRTAVKGIDFISHQAALGSVPRSIADPLTSHNVNVNGFLNVLEAGREAGIQRIVYASSSSVYGDLPDSPKIETRTGKVLSPYAATKMTNETYAQAWSKSYCMQLIGLRYFNVFGPRQDPYGPYAAVIPLFVKSALAGTPPTINGDGTITRDFTPVANVVQVNINSLLLAKNQGFHEVLNVACGATTSLKKLWQIICKITGTNVDAVYGPNRPGDILQSLADINAARQLIEYTPFTDLEAALLSTVEWYRNNKMASV